MKSMFRVFADRTAEMAGSPWAFFLVVAITAIWLAAGPAFHFSNTWQLTFASTQARRVDPGASEGARNQLVSLERLSDDELARLKEEFERLARSRATGA